MRRCSGTTEATKEQETTRLMQKTLNILSAGGHRTATAAVRINMHSHFAACRSATYFSAEPLTRSAKGGNAAEGAHPLGETLIGIKDEDFFDAMADFAENFPP